VRAGRRAGCALKNQGLCSRRNRLVSVVRHLVFTMMLDLSDVVLAGFSWRRASFLHCHSHSGRSGARLAGAALWESRPLGCRGRCCVAEDRRLVGWAVFPLPAAAGWRGRGATCRGSGAHQLAGDTACACPGHCARAARVARRVRTRCRGEGPIAADRLARPARVTAGRKPAARDGARAEHRWAAG